MKNRPVVLLTDFGEKDAYAGILKGVIASISPETKVIDLTHGIFYMEISLKNSSAAKALKAVRQGRAVLKRMDTQKGGNYV